MSAQTSPETGFRQYELEIDFNAPRERVWTAIISEIDAWWPDEFRMLGEGAVVELDVTPGGRGLLETKPDGGSLHWYAVQCFMPDKFSIYMVGNVAPDWGGPSTTNLKLALEETDAGCVLRVSDAHHGRVSEDYVLSLKNGWNQLFGESLKAFVEK